MHFNFVYNSRREADDDLADEVEAISSLGEKQNIN